MSGANEVRFTLKLMINKEKSKVLLASVDSEFADVLLSFLTLPLGRIMRILIEHYGDKAPAMGSLNALYTGLQNLDSVYFWKEAGKEMLLNPRTPVEDEYRKLKLNVYHAKPIKYFTCGCSSPLFCTSIYSENAICTQCGNLMNKQIDVERLSASKNSTHGVFAQQHTSFIICDDLRMLPNATGSILQTLTAFGIMDIDGAEYNTVTVGFNEIMDLLKGSLISRTPLTDLFLHKGDTSQSVLVKSELSTLLPPVTKEEKCTSKKIKVKITTQKSTNRFLFAQAGEDFVDFLFFLLVIPLGQVEDLLGINSSMGCIDNLYQSVAGFADHKYMIQQTKDILLKPKLPWHYLSNNHIISLPVTEQSELYYYYAFDYKLYVNIRRWSHLSTGGGRYTPCSLVDPKGQGSYVKSDSMFIVADDLTVTPFCMLSSLSALMHLGVPLSDITEVEINIGLEEALNILKASLTSTSALTNGLKLDNALPKQPKKEKI